MLTFQGKMILHALHLNQTCCKTLNDMILKFQEFHWHLDNNDH